MGTDKTASMATTTTKKIGMKSCASLRGGSRLGKLAQNNSRTTNTRRRQMRERLQRPQAHRMATGESERLLASGNDRVQRLLGMAVAPRENRGRRDCGPQAVSEGPEGGEEGERGTACRNERK